MNQSTGWWPRVLAVVMVGVVSGCGFTQGLHRPTDDGFLPPEYRFETELIANATLVREDTMPRWQLGRHAFKRGPDNVLVISRIHSFAERNSAGKQKKGGVVKRYDANLERVWIVLPLGTQVGDTVRIDKLEYEFLTGYDEGKIADGEMFIQPVRLLGKLTVLEMHPDSIVIDIDMVVEPRRFTRWHYKRVETVLVTTTGIRARPARLTAKERMLAATAKAEANATEHTSGDADQPALEPQTPTVQPSDDDENTAAAATQPADEPLDVEKYIMGKWIGQSPSKRFDVRFQFNPTGEFVYSTCRTGFAPMLKIGRYSVKRGYVILSVDYYGSWGKKDQKHPKPDVPFEMIKVYPVNDHTVVMKMTGEGMTFRDPKIKEVQVSRGEFQDMFVYPPPIKR